MNSPDTSAIKIIVALFGSGVMLAMVKLNLWYRRERREDPDLAKDNDYNSW